MKLHFDLLSTSIIWNLLMDFISVLYIRIKVK